MADAAVSAHPVRRSLWVRIGIPLVIVAVALAIGSGVFSGKPETAAQRAARIEAVVRCPSCIDVSVAQSQETTALAVRHEIERQVARGSVHGADRADAGRPVRPEHLAGTARLGWICRDLDCADRAGGRRTVVVGTLFWRRSRLFAATSAAQAKVSADTGVPADTRP